MIFTQPFIYLNYMQPILLQFYHSSLWTFRMKKNRYIQNFETFLKYLEKYVKTLIKILLVTEF